MRAITNLINGNLTDAKRLAKKYSSWKIMNEAQEMGYKIVHAVAIAGYLKGVLTFQEYCNTMNEVPTNKELEFIYVH